MGFADSQPILRASAALWSPPLRTLYALPLLRGVKAFCALKGRKSLFGSVVDPCCYLRCKDGDAIYGSVAAFRFHFLALDTIQLKGAAMHAHVCQKCGETFSSPKKHRVFCTNCNADDNNTTARQYSMRDGHLRPYLNVLRSKNNHLPGKSRKGLTLEHLVEQWKKQGGLCAVSNIQMTYRAVKGEWFPYNISIDRIIPGSEGGLYEPDNIQLVCSIINSMMQDYSKEVFVTVCVAVADRFRELSQSVENTTAL